MIRREHHLQSIHRGLKEFPVLALLGPRQVGKTTLARQFAAEWRGPHHHFDLEDPDDLARLSDPSFALRPLTGLVVLDHLYLLCHAPEQTTPWPLAQGITALPLQTLASVVP
jgi:predicted AAA+ superfamily ATPase